MKKSRPNKKREVPIGKIPIRRPPSKALILKSIAVGGASPMRGCSLIKHRLNPAVPYHCLNHPLAAGVRSKKNAVARILRENPLSTPLIGTDENNSGILHGAIIY
jgi:hypothetical protein